MNHVSVHADLDLAETSTNIADNENNRQKTFTVCLVLINITVVDYKAYELNCSTNQVCCCQRSSLHIAACRCVYQRILATMRRSV